MKVRWLNRCAALALGAPAVLFAHDGVDHGAGATAADNAARPYWVSATRLHVGQALQRRLALRSDAANPAQDIRLSAEVLPHPSRTTIIGASAYGRIESAGRWPLAGQRVRAGELLAWLRPLLSVQQDSERRRDLQLLEQQLQIAGINLERLRGQVEASGGVGVNNVYYDEAVLDVAALRQRIELARHALEDRVALRAPADAVLAAVNVGNGDVVDTGSRLFTLTASDRLRIALPVYDAAQLAGPPPLSLRMADGRRVALTAGGQQPAADGQGWQLLYDGADPSAAALLPGEIVEVWAPAPAAPRPCLRNIDGAELWVQIDTELFERRRAAACEQIRVSATERWVRDGAAILAQYR